MLIPKGFRFWTLWPIRHEEGDQFGLLTRKAAFSHAIFEASEEDLALLWRQLSLQLLLSLNETQLHQSTVGRHFRICGRGSIEQRLANGGPLLDASALDTTFDSYINARAILFQRSDSFL